MEPIHLLLLNHYQGFSKSSSHPSLWVTSKIQNHLNSLEWWLNIVHVSSCLGFESQFSYTS